MGNIIVNSQNKAYTINGNAIIIAEPEFHDYLVFDGVAYVETDIVLPEDCSIRCFMGYETQRIPQLIYGAASANGQISVFINSSSTNSDRYFSVRYCSSSSLLTNRALGWSAYPTYALFQTPKRFGFGNASSTYTKGSSVPTGTLWIGELLDSTSSPFTGKMKTYTIYDSSAQNATTATELSEYTPVYTLEPCIYLGQAGFWNVQERKFYGNAATSGALSVDDD